MDEGTSSSLVIPTQIRMRYNIIQTSFLFQILFLIGIGVGSFYTLDNSINLLSLIILIIIFYFWRNIKIWLIIVSVIAFLLGGYAINSHLNHYRSLQKTLLDEKKTDFQVIIKSYPKKSNLEYQYKVNIKDTQQYLYIKLRSDEFKLGDILEIQGKIGSIPKESTKKYLISKNVHSYFQIKSYKKVSLDCNFSCSSINHIYNLKSGILDMLDFSYPGKVGEFLKGILIGYTDTLPDNIKTEFKKTGISHILAVSGYNVSLIIIFVYQFLQDRQVHRSKSLPITLFIIVIFTILTGAEASIIRASIFASIILIAESLQRYVGGLRPLILTAFVMNLLYPVYIIFDIGFQLSFLAVVGLLFYSNLFTTFSQGLPSLTLKNLIGETVAAQIMVLPILIYHFQEISLISILANALIVPFIPFFMLYGSISSILYSTIFTHKILTYPLELLIESILWINAKLAILPYSTISVPKLNFLYLIIIYFILYSIGYIIKRIHNSKLV